MTDLDVIERLARVSKIGRVYKQTTAAGKKPAWQWSVYVQGEVYAFLVAIFPLMGKRRGDKILEALREMGASPPPRPGRRKSFPQPHHYQTLSARRP